MAESVEVGRRVRLPSRAERPIQVFVNGREQAEGADYTLHGREIVFSRPLVKEKVSSGRWLAMTLGLFGTYGKNETVDVHFRRRDDAGGLRRGDPGRLMRVCLMIEGQESVSWEDWVALARACEESPMDALFRSDHYLSVMGKTDRELARRLTRLPAWRRAPPRCGWERWSPRDLPASIGVGEERRHHRPHLRGGRFELGMGSGLARGRARGLRLSVPGRATASACSRSRSGSSAGEWWREPRLPGTHYRIKGGTPCPSRSHRPT